jgi:hypothetical protein
MGEVLGADPWKIVAPAIALLSISLNIYQWTTSRNQASPKEYKNEIRSAIMDILSARHQTTIFEREIEVEYFGKGISSLEEIRKSVSRAIPVIDSASDAYVPKDVKFQVNSLSKKISELIKVRDSYNEFEGKMAKKGKKIYSAKDESEWPDRNAAMIKLHDLQNHLRLLENNLMDTVHNLR